MKVCTCIICLIFFCSSLAFAGHLHKEKEYQNAWCTAHNGVQEAMLGDKTRIDCVTDEYAIEFDFAKKWAEAVGQALYYALRIGKKPGVVLIMESEGDDKYLIRLQALGDRYSIKIWTMTPEELKE